MMKNTFSRVLALGFLMSAALPMQAQNQAPPTEPAPMAPKVPTFQLSDANIEVLALVGAFYSKMRHASTFRGRLVATKTLLKDGKAVGSRRLEVDSSWIGDGKSEGTFRREVSNLVYTVTGDKNSVEKFASVDDGIKNYRNYTTRKMWSERAQEPGGISTLLLMTRGAWTLSLLSFGVGIDFQIQRIGEPGKERIVASKGPNNGYVFDAKSGDLLSFKVANDTEATQFEWSQTQFEAPLPESLFVWRAPDGAKQVDPESVVIDVEF